MHKDEFDEFSKLLHRTAKVYGKTLDDELLQSYWRALKDLSLIRVTELAEHRLKHSKFFPKPVDLRPFEEKQPPSLDGKFEEGEERAMYRLEELRRDNPEEWSRQLSGRRAAEYAAQFGVHNIWFDVKQRCWRRHP
jgi:hypothetical protein